jgi:hypothetical protein
VCLSFTEPAEKRAENERWASEIQEKPLTQETKAVVGENMERSKDG